MESLIPNFCIDEVGAELFWIIDEDEKHINFKDDLHLMSKLEWGSVGMHYAMTIGYFLKEIKMPKYTQYVWL